MHSCLRGIPNVFFLEQVANHVRLLLPTMQMAANAVDHLRLAGWPTLAERIGFHVPVEQLVRIELRAISWQLNQTQTVSMIGDESPDCPGPMHGMAVDNQIDLVCGLFDHALRNSMNVAFLNLPSKTMKFNAPRLGIAEIMFQPKRCPVARTTGVCPLSAKLVPLM
ncbi:hypothetical protein LMG29542_08299 [Paraburkholderia humisilvae]|uniref:Uncharacterized protein n=1 Tax=Paraburkholderia humisilvae TaxID=627669 RepID=A0A6J5FBS9_9BURK|nr:hypothetical protein LMG29542_08299 [Paraburkholderia humisilvae]